MDNQRGFPGFRWVRSLTGGGPPSTLPLRVASGYTGVINGGGNIDINVGDPVRMLATGYAAHAAGNEAAAGAAQDILGIVVGIAPYWDGQVMTIGSRLPYGTTYAPIADRTSYILVWPAAGSVWEIDCDDAVTATTEAAYIDLIGTNADHRLTTGQEPRSNCLLDISTASPATAQWRIMNISTSQQNLDFSGAFVKLLVTVNETQQAPYVTAGI